MSLFGSSQGGTGGRGPSGMYSSWAPRQGGAVGNVDPRSIGGYGGMGRPRQGQWTPPQPRPSTGQWTPATPLSKPQTGQWSTADTTPASTGWNQQPDPYQGGGGPGGQTDPFQGGGWGGQTDPYQGGNGWSGAQPNMAKQMLGSMYGQRR